MISKLETNKKKKLIFFKEFKDSFEVSQRILWDTLKAVVRGRIISITSHLKRLKGQKLVDLNERLKQLTITDSKNIILMVKGDIKGIQREIDDIYTQDTQKKIFV